LPVIGDMQAIEQKQFGAQKTLPIPLPPEITPPGLAGMGIGSIVIGEGDGQGRGQIVGPFGVLTQGEGAHDGDPFLGAGSTPQ
jgi:hypothetical protein